MAFNGWPVIIRTYENATFKSLGGMQNDLLQRNTKYNNNEKQSLLNSY
jgi:hypothetical protein